MSFASRFAVAASIISLLGLTACGGTQTPDVSSTSSADDTTLLKLLYWQAPTILNPHLSTGFKDWEAGRITLEPLATFDENSKLMPILAAEIPTVENGGVAEDGLSVTWKRRRLVL